MQIPKRKLQLHVWGALNWDGPGPLRLIKGNLNVLRYQALIHDIQNICRGAYYFLKNIYLSSRQCSRPFSKVYSKFILRKKIIFLSWPAISPYLNIIEQAWSYISRRIRSYGLPKNKQEFWELVQSVWYSMPISYIHSLNRSVSRQLQQTLHNQGSQTRY